MTRGELYSSECKILAEHFGTLTEGKVIKIDLSQIFTLVPRASKQTASYKGLRNYMKRTTGCTLIVTSQQTKEK